MKAGTEFLKGAKKKGQDRNPALF